MLLTFYRGPQINTWSTHLNLLHGSQRMDEHEAETHNTSSHHMIGSVLPLTASLSIAVNFILQSKMNVDYPCFYSSSFLTSVMGFMKSFGYALCTERSWSQWKLGWNVRLISVGFMCVGLYVVLWGKGKEEKRVAKLMSVECSKDLNDVSNTTATNTTLETVSMARTSFSVVYEGDELSVKSPKEKHKDQEISEEV